MKWYEVIEDCGDGSNTVRRFEKKEDAIRYCELNEEWCYEGFEEVDTNSKYFFDRIDENGEMIYD